MSRTSRDPDRNPPTWRSSEWRACSPAPRTSTRTGRTSCAGSMRSARSRASGGTPTSTSTPRASPDRRRLRNGAASWIRSRSSPRGTASRRARSPRSIRPSSCRWRWRGGRSRTRATAGVSSIASAPPWCSGPRAAPTSRTPTASAPSTRATRAACPASSTPSCPFPPRTASPACWPTSSAAGSRTGSTSGGRTTRSTRPARRRWRRCRWACTGSPPAPATWCWPAAPTSTARSATSSCSPASTRCRRAASAARSTRARTGSRSARGSASSCSSAWPTRSGMATGSTPSSRGSPARATARAWG